MMALGQGMADSDGEESAVEGGGAASKRLDAKVTKQNNSGKLQRG
jgi:hypothetical protein